MNILVTGGAGFIGSHTVVALVEAGFTPVIVDDFSNSERLVLDGLEKILGRSVSCYEADCNDAAAMRDIFEREKPAGVIHFAAFKAVGESMAEPLKYYRNNLGSLITLLEIMQETGAPNLIFSSSATVYGQPEHLPVKEDSPAQPAMSVYGNTKRIGEEILRDVAAAGKPFKIISLRYFNPIGAHPSGLIGELPRGVPNNLVPFITQTAAGLRPQLSVFGDDYDTPDGTAIRDYIHVMDLAEAHVTAFQHLAARPETALYEAINVGTGEGASVMQVIRSFEAASGQKLNFHISPRRPGDVESVYADVSKAARELGWTARRSLHEALTDAWRWQCGLRKEDTRI
ncbi:MAG: UDP-glucose 4-epimerase GalE [Saprospiraceae bacterium]|nr:UDP-glucose 4-epimerase GalE [Saprospiraceae bacterium]